MRLIAALGAVAYMLALSPRAFAGTPPSLSWSPTTSVGAYNYGTLEAGQTSSVTFTLKNSGGSATAALTISLTGSGAFTKTADTCSATSLGRGMTCHVTVQYAPVGDGQTDQATLLATSKKPAASASITLTGASGTPHVVLTKLPDAPSVAAGTSIGYTITVSNDGTATANSVMVSDSLPTNTGLSWGIDTANTTGTWTITAGTLSLGPVTLSPSASYHVHITSPTTSATGTVNNSASATSANGGNPTVGPVAIAVRNPPVLSNIESDALQYYAETPPVPVTSTLTVMSPDTSTLVGATVSISSGLASTEDALGFTTQNGITGSYDASTGVLTLSGTASVAAYQTALRSVTFGDAYGLTLGPRTISFQVDDGLPAQNRSNVVSRTVNVSPNATPVAVSDSYTASKNNPLTVAAASGVLANDTDPDGDLLHAILDFAPAHGTLVLNPDGAFTYTPAQGYTGTDIFTYVAADSAGNVSNVATVFLTVTDQAPVANNDSYAATENTSLTISAPGVLGNDTDPNGDALTAVLVSGPAHGTLTLSADGSFTYTPAPGYTGSDSFTYKANDGTLDSNVATVSLTVSNSPPVASNDSYSGPSDATLTVIAPGVLANDSDVDGDSLSAVLVSGPAHGTLTLNADGSFSYRPAPGYFGSDSFTYKANDGTFDSNVATVSLTIINAP
jgi:uncharacterized repeat protein (TIGR01451 family)